MKRFPVMLFVVTLVGVGYASFLNPVIRSCDGRFSIYKLFFPPKERPSEEGGTQTNDAAVRSLNVQLVQPIDPQAVPGREKRILPEIGERYDPVEEKLREEAYRKDRQRAFFMQAGISVLVCCAALFVILAGRFAPADRHWASATVGTLLGFWLRGAS